MERSIGEILRYCREENTFGALLFCGEWGIGKTYLLEHEVAARLGDGFQILRISLFGEESVEGVRRKVQRAWRAFLREAEPEKELPEPEFSLPQPEGAGKRVILAFDDLERTNLSQVEILGCINEYCENLHMKTIVIANEEKLEALSAKRTGITTGNPDQSAREYLLYSEMKEKLIVRTVKLEPDYVSIVESIVRGYRTQLPGYGSFLMNRCHDLTLLLEECEVRNLRSLRSGMQDFERIYEMTEKEGLAEEDMRKYFTSFVLFTILAKAGKISRSHTRGYSLNRLQQKYPDQYEDRYMPDCIKDGIMTGEWREDEIRTHIIHMKEYRSGRMKPWNRLRMLSLMEMDDETVEDGWETFLAMAYAGELTPEEYLRLLQNLVQAREVGYSWPQTPAIRRLQEGAGRALEYVCEGPEAPAVPENLPEEDGLEAYSEEEREIAEEITEFYEKKQYRYAIARREILRALKERNRNELYRCRRNETDRFDLEMAEEAMNWYESLTDNRSRVSFRDLILKILSGCTADGEENEIRTGEGINRMKMRLLELADGAAGRPLRQTVHWSFRERIVQWEKNGS